MKRKMKIRKRRFKNFKVNMYALLIFSLVGSTIVGILTRRIFIGIFSLLAFFVLFIGYNVVRMRLQRAAEVKKMEEVFPDFIELMSSNLRAGMTIDKALLLSSRKEFTPLDKEILSVGKEIMTGKEIESALIEMSNRIGSDKIRKTILLLNSGIRSGGNLSVLLEQTAVHLRERSFVEKRAASNILMYVIFIFFAVAVGAPILFSLSSVLVEILTTILQEIPTDQTNLNLPFTITQINISSTFVIYFAAFFLVVIDILAALILGLVNKGSEREGVKYIIPLLATSLSVYFLSRIFLLRYFSNLFG